MLWDVGTKINDRYLLLEYIGSGVWGEVWRAHDGIMDMDVAVKAYASIDLKGFSELQKDYKIAFNITNEYILSPKHIDVAENRPFIIFPYCKNGNIRHLLYGASGAVINEGTMWKVLHDLSSGLSEMHQLSMCHHNIKPENILISNDYSFVLADFRLSKSTRATMSKEASERYFSSTAYKSPESISGKMESEKSDIWSLGIIAFELATGRTYVNTEYTRKNIHDQLSNFSVALRDTICSCLNIDPEKRPTANELVQNAKRMMDAPPNESAYTSGTHGEKQKTTKAQNEHPRSAYKTLVRRHWFVTLCEWLTVIVSLFLVAFSYLMGSIEPALGYCHEWFIVALLYSVKMIGEILLLRRAKIGYWIASAAVLCSTFSILEGISRETIMESLLWAAVSTAIYMFLFFLVLMIKKDGNSQWKTMEQDFVLSNHKWVIYSLLVALVVFGVMEIVVVK